MTEKPATYTTRTNEPPALSGAPPQDLSPQAVKLARRIQALPRGTTYTLILFKGSDRWILCVQGQGKSEVIR